MLAAAPPRSIGFKTSRNGTNETIGLYSKGGCLICDIFNGLFLAMNGITFNFFGVYLSASYETGIARTLSGKEGTAEAVAGRVSLALRTAED